MNYFLLAFSKAFSVFLLLFVCSFTSLHAQNWNQIVKIAANHSLPTAGMSYGFTVAMFGDYAAVQATAQSNPSSAAVNNAGVVYVLHNNAGNWEQVKVIYSPHQTSSGFFGISMGISNDYLVISGRDKAADLTTAAYIYGRNQGGADQWGMVKEILLPTSSGYSTRSSGVAISGDNIIIGNANEPNGTGQFQTGSVSLYNKDQGGLGLWGLVNKLTIAGAITKDALGVSVSIDGDYAVAGATGENAVAGAAYIFKRNSITGQWSQIKKLTSSVPANNDFFGNSLAQSGPYIVIGAYGDARDEQGLNLKTNAGSAYIFKKDQNDDNWVQIKKITASDRAAQDSFANSVSISGNYLVVGTPNNGVAAKDFFGAAFIYKKDQGGIDQWGEIQKLTGTTRSVNDQFGNSVAISGGKIMTGSFKEDYNASGTLRIDAGVVYVIGAEGGLPVNLVSFEANRNENQAFLKWSTSSETNSDFFAIERSVKGTVWETLDKVEASRKSTSLKTYSYLDTKPNTGENLYRLKMIDSDGSFAYSRIRSLSFGDAEQIILYPNPTSGRLYSTSPVSGNIESVRLVNVTGQVVAQFSEITKDGMPINHLATGMYSVQIKKTDGTTQFQKVIVVK
ncbi:MAG: T9SS type A sorting domain-containing protein [Dyadobacter sp.]